ncbi:MAG: tellurite resistance protein [Sphingopyxis sp.]|nr:tellurite resistance protein [Sphingopyxis sp.]
MNSDLPPGLAVYKRTPTFTEDSLPRGLSADHATKESVWGLIRVEEGKLLYTVTDPRRPYREQFLLPDSEPGVVEPTIVHRVKPIGRVRFHVEFLRSEFGPGKA